MKGPRSRVGLRVGVLLGALLCLAGTAAAQQAPGPPTAERILAALRESGVPREEFRARLATLGYDPRLGSSYFDRIEGASMEPLAVDPMLTAAVTEMGLFTATPGVPPAESTGVAPREAAAELRPFPAPAEPDTLRIFGRDVFGGATTQFQPVLMGPVDPGYRLGPGDELFLSLTGDVEQSYAVEVGREGYVAIPDVGQISVNGLTLEGLRGVLYQRLGRVYSGVRRGPGATTFFEVTLGRLRTSQVFVIGDVVRPGSYLVSSVATVFTALHQAGGPSDLGSFRSVQVRRGGESVATIDLYDYLARGDASRDLRLEHGDIVFVPPAGPQVAVAGSVRRPAIYELAASEGIRDALGFAAGFGADAHVRRIQVDRVLAPSERRPGIDRVLLDVELAELADPDGAPIPLRDGDEVRVFASLPERRNRVVLTGSVWRPGVYEYRPGMTVWDLIQRADGLSEEAFRLLAHVVRPVPETGGSRLLRLSLETDRTGSPDGDLPLADGDSVVVYAADSLSTARFVRVEGYVKAPGDYPFAEGMAVRDLIVAAGGFQEGAESYRAEVVRLRRDPARNDTIAVRHAVLLDGDLPAWWVRAAPSPLPRAGANGIIPIARSPGTGSVPTGADFALEEGDRVFVRRLPGYVTHRTVTVEGEVGRAGPYALERREERLSSVLARSGGLTPEAHLAGARLLRDSILVAVDFTAALANPGAEGDIVLEHGDRIEVPRRDPTVLVQGAVAFEAQVLYRDDLDLKDYLEQAGGPVPDADMERVSVLYPNGERAMARRWLFTTSYPEIEPGSTIFVPRDPDPGGFDLNRAINRTASLAGSLLTLFLIADRVSN